MPEVQMGQASGALLCFLALSFTALAGLTASFNSNPAYNILGAVAERVTGSSWHQVFQDTLAGPLGLQDTYFVNVFAGEVREADLI